MLTEIAPFLAALALFAIATFSGMVPVVRLIKIREARHELREDSAGFLRRMGGWSLIAFWGMSVWFTATVIGDWWATEDLSGAIDRAMLRLRILLEIAAAFGD